MCGLNLELQFLTKLKRGPKAVRLSCKKHIAISYLPLPSKNRQPNQLPAVKEGHLPCFFVPYHFLIFPMNVHQSSQIVTGSCSRSNRKAMNVVLGSHWIPSSRGSFSAPGVISTVGVSAEQFSVENCGNSKMSAEPICRQIVSSIKTAGVQVVELSFTSHLKVDIVGKVPQRRVARNHRYLINFHGCNAQITNAETFKLCFVSPILIATKAQRVDCIHPAFHLWRHVGGILFLKN